MMTNICDLPEGCLSHILSLTSPVDVLRSSAVSKQFLSASVADTVWCNFLPSDCCDVISQSTSPIRRDHFSSKRELFPHLARFPLLLDNNTKSFALDKWSGKKCYMLGARAPSMAWESIPEYWDWESHVPESRFPECASLLQMCWLDITGKIQITLLSPGTTYGAYFVFRLNYTFHSSCFIYVTVKVSVSVDGEDDGLPRDDLHNTEIKTFFLDSRDYETRIPEERPVVRDDGWMEIEMGRYQVGRVHDAGERVVLEMALKDKEFQGGYWKKGLVVYGIEVRPLC